ncbi:DUF4168 domain-containing protein [Mesorhizobium sp. CAU 1741]|uniref:DUF4168 domain-containing protein n=1 Tax=Mesorhizobium sp. CAU 1741 TaxID=3140366 RepID=UPI00325B55D2
MMTIKGTFLAGISSLAIAFGASLGIAVAQDAAPSPQTQAPAEAAQIDEGKLQSFAVAFLEVTKVTQSYQPQIEAAATPEDQQRLQQEAGERMIQAVSDSDDITVDEYNQIIQAAQADPELAQRINTHISEAAEGQQRAPQQPATE